MAGRRIDDHSFWAGKGSKGSVFPEGVHIKPEHSEHGSGELSHYEDTTEAIAHQQAMNVKKTKGHAQKPGHRY